MRDHFPTDRAADAPPRELLERIAERLKALGDPTRLAILHALDADELCVGAVAEAVDTSQANVSKHLAVLRGAGLVTARREGMNVFYSVSDAAAFEVCRLMCGFAERRARQDLALVTRSSAPTAARVGVDSRTVTP